MEVNLRAAFLFSKAVLPIMKNSGSGYIVNISSLSGKTGHGDEEGTWGLSPYIASKFGLVGFSRNLAWRTRKDNINVSVVCPGNVDTRMLQEARGRRQGVERCARETIIKPSDIAEVVLFLVTRPHNVVIPEIMVYPRHHEN